eukprot:1845690-Pyramimonas_sp.AAC.1
MRRLEPERLRLAAKQERGIEPAGNLDIIPHRRGTVSNGQAGWRATGPLWGNGAWPQVPNLSGIRG